MSIIFDIFNTLLAVASLVFVGWVAWMSSILVSEKKERYRRGLTDYYDNPIKKDNNETVS